MTALEKTYPAYLGNEPYLHLCFSEKSSKKVLALLRRLRLRGVRVWYGAEVSSDRSAREAAHERMIGAALTVIYLDETFRNDPIAKSTLAESYYDNNDYAKCLEAIDTFEQMDTRIFRKNRDYARVLPLPLWK